MRLCDGNPCTVAEIIQTTLLDSKFENIDHDTGLKNPLDQIYLWNVRE